MQGAAEAATNLGAMHKSKLTQGIIFVAVTSALFLRTAAACSDYQTESYEARFTPSDCLKTCTVTPFFSPDTSLATYTQLIESATESIDIYTPGKLRVWKNRAVKLLRQALVGVRVVLYV